MGTGRWLARCTMGTDDDLVGCGRYYTVVHRKETKSPVLTPSHITRLSYYTLYYHYYYCWLPHVARRGYQIYHLYRDGCCGPGAAGGGLCRSRMMEETCRYKQLIKRTSTLRAKSTGVYIQDQPHQHARQHAELVIEEHCPGHWVRNRYLGRNSAGRPWRYNTLFGSARTFRGPGSRARAELTLQFDVI